MKFNTNFPYPVLHPDNDDYLNSSFQTELLNRQEFGLLKIIAKFHLKNEGLIKLVQDQFATYCIRVECPQTSYRELYESIEEVFEISVDMNRIRGKVFVHALLIAKKPITNYKNSHLNEWYRDINVSFEKGNLLAFGNSIEITLFEDHTDMLDLPAIIQVRKALESEVMDIEILSNTLVISLPEYEYNQYAGNANSRMKHSILTAVILPSLVHVFGAIKDNTGDLEEYTWYQVLEKIFETSGMNLRDVGTERLSALKAAQLVLQRPLKASFEEIENLNRMED